MFEVFREGHVPECEATDDTVSIFNDASGIDPEPEAEPEEDDESIF